MIDRLMDLDRSSPKRILVIGDAMRDVYVTGELDACQDGCPLYREHERLSVPGGAAGAARQLENWQSAVQLIASTCVVKTRYCDRQGRILWRLDEAGELTGAIPWAEIRSLLAQPWDAVLISDYSKGTLNVPTTRQIIETCQEKDIPCVADGKKWPHVYQGAILKCNSTYAANRYDSVADHSPAAVVTHGDEPPMIFCEQGVLNPCAHGRPVPCVNHVGAGDCFAAHLALALAHGLSLEDGCTIAHAAGRVYVQHAHGRPPWPHEIRRDLDPVGGKTVSGDFLSALRQSIPGRVVFTNGCFDLLGPQHVYLLQEARKHGGVLVVAVNSDESVRRLKGPKRPVVPLERRLAMLAALECVDWLVYFEGDTPAALMQALRPDVRVKGDFPDLNHEGDEFAAELVLVPPLPGWSTTTTLGRILANGIG